MNHPGSRSGGDTIPDTGGLACIDCRGDLSTDETVWVCRACGRVYTVEDGVLVVDRPEGVDLRIGDRLLDLHALRDEGRYYGDPIPSAVERAARVQSVAFADLHARLLGPHLAGAVVADLGCGQLPYAGAFAGRGIREYYAIDLSPESLAMAAQRRPADLPVRFVQSALYRVPLRSGSVDVVVSSETLEHLSDPMAYLAEIHRVCRPGGHLSLSTPCSSMYLFPHVFIGLLRHPGRVRDWWRWMHADTCWKDALSWHPALRPSVLRAWMERAGFRVLRHVTRLWHFATRLRPAWRLFAALERMGVDRAGPWFGGYLRTIDRILEHPIPVLRWAGTRQFVLCERA
jgi:SAM-dependent methyltransferase